MTLSCPLCTPAEEDILWRDAFCRVILIDDPAYPGFCRVILNRHVGEMSDLPESERHRLMDVVFAVEAVLRRLMRPDKINLASLGNIVPHVHWHVIPRFAGDTHFPQPVWAAPQRTGARHDAPDRDKLRAALAESLPMA